ncbi:MAG: hypothetical protein IJW65_02035 [Clostridia bacterium]|nr:hypothetical protein [Clostridia bacterium]
MKERTKEKIKRTVGFLLNPRLLLCLFIAWLITNGWAYILFFIGTALRINWMLGVSGAYLTFLWLPISPEKIVTVAIAIGLLRLLFPNDKKTLAILRGSYEKIKAKFKRE